MFQFALPSPLLPFKFDIPAFPVPLFRFPKASQKKQTPQNSLHDP